MGRMTLGRMRAVASLPLGLHDHRTDRLHWLVFPPTARGPKALETRLLAVQWWLDRELSL